MVAKKTKMPILSTTGLSFCWPAWQHLFCSSASMGTTGCLGGELGADEDRPQRDDDQDRPGTDGEINGTHGHARKAVGFHKARELTRLLDGSGQGQNAAAGHADHHDREHILAAAVSPCYRTGRPAAG